MENSQAAFERGVQDSRYEKADFGAEKERIIAFLDSLEALPTEEILKLNIPFWMQALQRDPKVVLHLDTREDALHPSRSEEDRTVEGWKNSAGLVALGLRDNIESPDMWLQIFPSLVKGYLSAKNVLGLLLKNYQSVQREFEASREAIREVLKGGNLVIVTNHSSWANFPLILHMLSQVFEGDLSPADIYTLVGPAITTRSDTFHSMTGLSNVIRTVPDTPNGNIIDPSIADKIRRKALMKCMRVVGQGTGKILFLNPSGTTDIEDNGTIQMQPPSSGTWDFLDALSKRGKPKFLSIGTNTSAIFPRNQHPMPGEGIVCISEFWDGEGSASEWIRATLPQQIQDSRGEMIGEWGSS